MAKDPAFLFYSSDFLTGTALFTSAETGDYIKLLCYMHQYGGMKLEDMKIICPGLSEKVLAKFKQKNGKFYNERLEKEIDKRRKYSESRANNRKGKKDMKNISDSYEPHMENEIINENVNEIKNDFGKSENLLLVPKMIEIYKKHNPNYPINKKNDYEPAFEIAKFLAEQGKLGPPEKHMEQIMPVWEQLSMAVSQNKFYRNKSLLTISRHIQEIVQIKLNGTYQSVSGKSAGAYELLNIIRKDIDAGRGKDYQT